MATFISNAAAIASVNVVADLIDGGAGAGTLVCYSGSVPADADTALTGQTVLVTITFSDPAYDGAVDDTPGALATADITPALSAVIAASGTASFFRQFDSDSTCITQGTVGTAAADLIVDTVTFTAGVTFTIESLTMFMPESA